MLLDRMRFKSFLGLKICVSSCLSKQMCWFIQVVALHHQWDALQPLNTAATPDHQMNLAKLGTHCIGMKSCGGMYTAVLHASAHHETSGTLCPGILPHFSCLGFSAVSKVSSCSREGEQ